MGCGQSSLKGEKQEDIQEPAKPLKKVQTNFSTVDYDAAPNSKRRNTEYAPHDEIQQQRPSEALSPLTEKKEDPLSIDAQTAPTASTQVAGTTAPSSTAFENTLPTQTTQNPIGEEVGKVEPYRDVTASPTTPTANNVAVFSETQQINKPAQAAQ